MTGCSLRWAPVSSAVVTCLPASLSASDRREIAALTAAPFDVIIAESVARSAVCYAILVEDDLLGIVGVAPDPETAGSDSGQIWQLSTTKLRAHRIAYLRACAGGLALFHSIYPHLWNVIDARNRTTIRWLDWCGFVFTRRLPGFGINGELFYRFERRSRIGNPTWAAAKAAVCKSGTDHVFHNCARKRATPSPVSFLKARVYRQTRSLT